MSEPNETRCTYDRCRERRILEHVDLPGRANLCGRHWDEWCDIAPANFEAIEDFRAKCGLNRRPRMAADFSARPTEVDRLGASRTVAAGFL